MKSIVTYKVVNADLFNSVDDVELNLTSSERHFQGDVSIEINGEWKTISGQHGANDYADDYGFQIVMEFEIKNVKPFEVEPRDFTIEWNKIQSVYKGRLNACACGCAGEYLYTQHYAKCKAKNDGNRLFLDKVSDKQDLFIQGILNNEFQNNNITYIKSNDEWIFEVETNREVIKDDYRLDEEIVYGYRVYQKFNTIK